LDFATENSVKPSKFYAWSVSYKSKTYESYLPANPASYVWFGSKLSLHQMLPKIREFVTL
jgi:hypothetical protein